MNKGSYSKLIACSVVALAPLCLNIFSEVNIKEFFEPFIQNSHILNIVVFIASWIIEALLFLVLFVIFSFGYKILWKITHRKYYLDGVWLNIHDKENVKIGVVEIKQDFYNIQVTATNVAPDSTTTNATKTKWEYIGNSFGNTNNNPLSNYLACCYSAKRTNDSEKYGVHIFDDPREYSTGNFITAGYPTVLVGTFGDSIEKENLHRIEGCDKTGRLYFFKLGKGGINLDGADLKRLRKNHAILANTEEYNRILKGTSYDKTLIEIKNKNRILSNYNEFIETFRGTDQYDMIDNLTATLLIYIISADHYILEEEVKLLNDLLKKRWTRDYLNNIANNNDDIITHLRNSNRLGRYRAIIMEICDYLIKVDKNIAANEQYGREMIDTLLH